MVFYTKKAKAKMRERQRKKLKSDADGNKDGGDQHEHNDSASNQQNRKRAADQISTDGAQQNGVVNKKAKSDSQKQLSTTIIIPANLTPKEAKKFRKDARRNARVEGQAEDQLKFIIEGQEEKEPQVDEEKDAKKKKAKNKKEVPRINDLLIEHATQQKINEKLSKQKSINDALPSTERERYIAIDCEMVGVGTEGKKSALARASVVNWDGAVLLDTFVRVEERVTDFRTHVSGVRPKNIHVTNESAMSHEDCRDAVGKLLHNKILVGHALKNDLSVLMLAHPRSEIRDTAKYKPFMRATGRSGGKLRPRKLRDLVLEHLGMKIQVEGEAHCSIDDASATMELFKVVKGRWEKELLAGKKKKKS